MTDPTIITWDWREGAPWSRVTAAIREHDNATIHTIPTNDDDVAIVIADASMTPADALTWYREHSND